VSQYLDTEDQHAFSEVEHGQHSKFGIKKQDIYFKPKDASSTKSFDTSQAGVSDSLPESLPSPLDSQKPKSGILPMSVIIFFSASKNFFCCRNDVQAIDFLRKGSYAPVHNNKFVPHGIISTKSMGHIQNRTL
jgi:hypothetical protein